MKKLVQILIGILFLVSGVFKVIDIKSFAELISSYGFPYLQVLAPFIASIEIILGICIILDIETRIVSFLIMLLTIGFNLIFTYAYFVKGIEDCGCMGKEIKVPAYISFIRNIFIIALTYWLWRTGERDREWIKPWKKWLVYIVTGVSLCIGGSTYGKPILFNETIQKKKSIDIELFMKYFNDKVPKSGYKLIYLFSPNCDHCWNSTENIKSMKAFPKLMDVTGITYDDEDLNMYVNELKPNFEIIKVPHNDLNNIISETPVLVVLQNGHLRYYFVAGDIPCGVMLHKMLVSEEHNH